MDSRRNRKRNFLMKRIYLLLALGLAWGTMRSAVADDGCCAHCRCRCQTEKVCRVVAETKKVPKVCYSCKCDDVCLPGKSELCGSHCECVPDVCDPCCVKEKKVHDWIPGCAEVRSRAKLYKTVKQVEVKSYKWVVEDLCPHCAANCEHSAGASNPPAQATELTAPLPPPPTASVDPGSAGDELAKSTKKRFLSLK